MSVLLKRSTEVMAIRPECPWRCCSDVYGKHVKALRRQVKQKDRNKWKNEVRQEIANS